MDKTNLSLKPAGLYLNATETNLSMRKNAPELPYKSLPKTNNLTWGVRATELMVIGARTSMGKTAFSLQIISDLMDIGVPILYMSFEMKPINILERLFIHKYKINNMDLLRGGFSNYLDQWEEFKKYIKNKRIVIGDGFGKNWEEINSLIINVADKPKVLVLDYIQSIAQSSIVGKQFIDEYLRKYRQICAENNIAGIIVSQLNRTNPDSSDKRPKLHQLKGSGYLEEHADSVILLDWLCKSINNRDKHAFTVEVAKNRNGLTGFVNVDFTPETYTFEEKSDEEESKPNHEVKWDD